MVVHGLGPRLSSCRRIENVGNGGLVPLVAQSIPKVASDGLAYTFTLRRDVKWSDGKPLTSERWFVQATGQVVKTAL